MYIIGIDPGATGGMCVIPLFNFNQTEVYRFSGCSPEQLSQRFKEFTDLNGYRSQVEVYLENPSLAPYLPGVPCKVCKRRPMRNSQSYTVLNRSIGLMEGLTIAHGYPLNLLDPKRWQNYLGCSTGGDKKITRVLAQKCFPFLIEYKEEKARSTVDDDVADCLLIGLYGYLQYSKVIPLSVRQSVDTIYEVRPDLRSIQEPKAKGIYDEQLSNTRTSIQPSPVSYRTGPVRTSTPKPRVPSRNPNST